MGAVAGHAVDGDAVAAELRPAGPAVLAPPAALVVMVHHAAADQPRIDAGAHGMHDAARLVSPDHRRARAPEAEPRGRISRRTIGMQIAPAHPRRLDGQHHLTRPRRRIRELLHLELAAPQKHDPAHRSLLRESKLYRNAVNSAHFRSPASPAQSFSAGWRRRAEQEYAALT